MAAARKKRAPAKKTTRGKNRSATTKRPAGKKSAARGRKSAGRKAASADAGSKNRVLPNDKAWRELVERAIEKDAGAK